MEIRDALVKKGKLTEDEASVSRISILNDWYRVSGTWSEIS